MCEYRGLPTSRLTTSERILLQLEGINRRLDKVVEAQTPTPVSRDALLEEGYALFERARAHPLTTTLHLDIDNWRKRVRRARD